MPDRHLYLSELIQDSGQKGKSDDMVTVSGSIAGPNLPK